jgi:hypothetical protein
MNYYSVNTSGTQVILVHDETREVIWSGAKTETNKEELIKIAVLHNAYKEMFCINMCLFSSKGEKLL